MATNKDARQYLDSVYDSTAQAFRVITDIGTLNDLVEGTIAYGSITASYTTLVDLTTTTYYTNLIINNTCNQPIAISLNSVSEINVPASTSYQLNGLYHNGLLKIKYTGSAPGSGSVVTKSW